MISKQIKRHFAFFGNHISRKHGQKCCPYGQNGKPLSQEVVRQFLSRPENTAWQTDASHSRIYRIFYFRNVFKMTAFIKDLYELDAETSQQIPNLSVIDRDLVKVELYTPALKGLSGKDFQLAAMVDSMDLEKYDFVEIQSEKGYKKEIRAIELKEQEDRLMREIQESAGGLKLDREKEKFKN